MKPVIQKSVNGKHGDCFGACIASILELDEWPTFFNDNKGDWISQWNRWLGKYGLEVVFVQPGHPAPLGYSIMQIKSVNISDGYHAVVWKGEGYYGDGQVVHDPSPLKHPDDYVPTGWFVLALLDAGRQAHREWAEKNGYVKLAEDQILPYCTEGNRPRAKAFKDMVDAGFRKVILKE
jgi:hypothetical protein